MNKQLYNAILNRSVISFTYHGHHRVVEPHAYGISTAENEVLRGYQISGTSRYGVVPGWRLFLVSEIVSLSNIGTNFVGPRDKYVKDDKGMTIIYVEL